MNSDQFLSELDAALTGTDRNKVERILDIYDDQPSLRSVAPYDETHDRIGEWFDAARLRDEAERVESVRQCRIAASAKRARAHVEGTTT